MSEALLTSGNKIWIASKWSTAPQRVAFKTFGSRSSKFFPKTTVESHFDAGNCRARADAKTHPVAPLLTQLKKSFEICSAFTEKGIQRYNPKLCTLGTERQSSAAKSGALTSRIRGETMQKNQSNQQVAEAVWFLMLEPLTSARSSCLSFFNSLEVCLILV